MIDTQLIMLEGLPSTGKTTNARFIHIQLERGNINAHWVHEVALPHPVLFFDEAGFTHDEYGRFIKIYPEAASTLNNMAVFKKNTVGITLPEIEWRHMDNIGSVAYQALLEYDVWNFPLEKYKVFALDKWAHFAENALGSRGTVFIIDSALFQFQIFSFLFQNRPYEELAEFVGQITETILPLNPCLIYLHRDDTEATINYLENDRGASYLEYLYDRDKNQPYYIGRQPGAGSFKQFLRDYAIMAGKLFDAFPAKKISLEISNGGWAGREDEMLAFIGAGRVPGPEAAPPNGVYINSELGFVIKINGLSFTDPTGKERKLYVKSQNEFYVDWLPTVLRFENGKIIISGSQVAERWTTTGLEYC